MIITAIFSARLPALWQEQVAQQSSLVDLILRASLFTKFVLLVLLLFSIASWAIIFTKARATRLAQQQSAQFLQAFARASHWTELYAHSARFDASPLSRIVQAAHNELEKQARLNLDAVARVMRRAAIQETTKLERSLSWLASTASAAPLIGLFGMVIGLIISFQGLSQATTASFQAVAPRIAEALVAAAAGIAAAVPAVLAYNYYRSRIKLLASEMDSFALRLLNFIEREAQAG